MEELEVELEALATAWEVQGKQDYEASLRQSSVSSEYAERGKSMARKQCARELRELLKKLG